MYLFTREMVLMCNLKTYIFQQVLKLIVWNRHQSSKVLNPIKYILNYRHQNSDKFCYYFSSMEVDTKYTFVACILNSFLFSILTGVHIRNNPTLFSFKY